MTDNKICGKLQYKCGICGKVYDSIAERTKCETECLKRQEEEVKKAAEEKKALEKEARQKEVDEALARAYQLMNDFTADYGSYHYNNKNVDNIFSDPLFYHLFQLLP